MRPPLRHVARVLSALIIVASSALGVTAAAAPAQTSDGAGRPGVTVREVDGRFETTECFRSLPGRNAPADRFRAMWLRSRAGWTGGDGVFTHALPDGRVLWLFGDSFIGGTAFVHNSFVIQRGRCLTTLRGGTRDRARALIAPSAPLHWYWPADAIVRRGELQVLLWRFNRRGTGDWAFNYLRSEVARFSLPDLELRGIRPVTASHLVSWGAALMRTPRYTYIYGTTRHGLTQQLHVARVRGDDLRRRWQYFTGSGWSTVPRMSAAVPMPVSTTFSVMRTRTGYLLLTQEPFFGRGMQAYTATFPEGPWTGPTAVGTVPDPGAGAFVYNGMAHSQWTDDSGALLVGSSSNGPGWETAVHHRETYVPWFIRIPPSALPAQPLPPLRAGAGAHRALIVDP
jgi:hypothetical protein